MKLSSKSKNRIELLDVITEGISTQEVFKTPALSENPTP